jgi:hypothetical protein
MKDSFDLCQTIPEFLELVETTAHDSKAYGMAVVFFAKDGIGSCQYNATCEDLGLAASILAMFANQPKAQVH